MTEAGCGIGVPASAGVASLMGVEVGVGGVASLTGVGVGVDGTGVDVGVGVGGTGVGVEVGAVASLAGCSRPDGVGVILSEAKNLVGVDNVASLTCVDVACR